MGSFEIRNSVVRSSGARVADVLLGIGQVHGRRADYDKATAALTESLAIATRLGNDRLIAGAANNLGIDPSVLIGGAEILSGAGQQPQVQAPPTARRTGKPQDETGRFVNRVLSSADERWRPW